MARLARMVISGTPHHVTQRGNRRERIFFEAGDEQIYLDLMAAQLKRYGVECWAYCLMPNHVHLILTPSDESGLARAVGEAIAASPPLSVRGDGGSDICFKRALLRLPWMRPI